MGYILTPLNGSDIEVESEARRDVFLERGYTLVEPEPEVEKTPEPPADAPKPVPAKAPAKSADNK